MINLLTGVYDAEWTPEQVKAVEELGYSIQFFHPRDPQSAYDPSETEVFISGRQFIVKNGIEQFPKLRFLQIMGIGYDQLPYEQLRRKQVRLANARGMSNVPISEWIVGKILEGCKRSRALYEQQREHLWKLDDHVWELSGKTVTIVGLGNIGAAAAQRLRAFDVHIIAVGRKKYESPYIDESILLDNMDSALERSDVVVITTQSTPETYHLFNTDRFAAMKENSILVNVARGALIDEQALLEVIDKFRFVALDVLEKEPGDRENPLWERANVSITPHNSFVTDQESRHVFPIMYENLKRYSEGKPLMNEITY